MCWFGMYISVDFVCLSVSMGLVWVSVDLVCVSAWISCVCQCGFGVGQCGFGVYISVDFVCLSVRVWCGSVWIFCVYQRGFRVFVSVGLVWVSVDLVCECGVSIDCRPVHHNHVPLTLPVTILGPFVCVLVCRCLWVVRAGVGLSLVSD